jgi:hypothetical protein
MGTAVNDVILFYTVPDDAALAMRAYRGELLDRAFETVERIGLTG